MAAERKRNEQSTKNMLQNCDRMSLFNLQTQHYLGKFKQIFRLTKLHSRAVRDAPEVGSGGMRTLSSLLGSKDKRCCSWKLNQNGCNKSGKLIPPHQPVAKSILSTRLFRIISQKPTVVEFVSLQISRPNPIP